MVKSLKEKMAAVQASKKNPVATGAAKPLSILPATEPLAKPTSGLPVSKPKPDDMPASAASVSQTAQSASASKVQLPVSHAAPGVVLPKPSVQSTASASASAISAKKTTDSEVGFLLRTDLKPDSQSDFDFYSDEPVPPTSSSDGRDDASAPLSRDDRLFPKAVDTSDFGTSFQNQCVWGFQSSAEGPSTSEPNRFSISDVPGLSAAASELNPRETHDSVESSAVPTQEPIREALSFSQFDASVMFSGYSLILLDIQTNDERYYFRLVSPSRDSKVFVLSREQTYSIALSDGASMMSLTCKGVIQGCLHVTVIEGPRDMSMQLPEFETKPSAFASFKDFFAQIGPTAKKYLPEIISAVGGLGITTSILLSTSPSLGLGILLAAAYSATIGGVTLAVLDKRAKSRNENAEETND